MNIRCLNCGHEADALHFAVPRLHVDTRRKIAYARGGSPDSVDVFPKWRCPECRQEAVVQPTTPFCVITRPGNTRAQVRP